MLVIVDAENVRRSIWPNVSREELVELLAGWKDASGDAPLVVFDGGAPDAVAGVDAVRGGAAAAGDWVPPHAARPPQPLVLRAPDPPPPEAAPAPPPPD